MIFKNAIIKKVLNGEINFKLLPKKYRDDESIAYNAVAYNGLNLKYVSDRLKEKESIVRRAVSQNPDAIKYANDITFIDLTIVSTALRNAKNPIDFFDFARYCACIHPEIYEKLPLCYFEEENKEYLQKIQTAILEGIKAQVGNKVTKEDEERASNAIEMMKTVRAKRKEHIETIKNRKEASELIAKAEEEMKQAKRKEFNEFISDNINSFNKYDNGNDENKQSEEIKTQGQASNIDIDESEKE